MYLSTTKGVHSCILLSAQNGLAIYDQLFPPLFFIKVKSPPILFPLGFQHFHTKECELWRSQTKHLTFNLY